MRFDEAVALPDSGPRSGDENETGFEKVGGEQQAAERTDDQPPLWTRESRSTRAATSR
jgi:hypothetical protein